MISPVFRQLKKTNEARNSKKRADNCYRLSFNKEGKGHPRTMSDSRYHYHGILDSMEAAASKMPRVDGIGVSAAGIYIDNQVKVASLFLKVNKKDFDKNIKNIFLRIAEKFGVPIEVANDGDVTALAGAMSLNETKVLGMRSLRYYGRAYAQQRCLEILAHSHY